MSNTHVRGERCPVTGAEDVVTTADGTFLCLSSGVKWSKPKGRGIDRASVQAFRKRGPLSSRGQSDVSRQNHNAADRGQSDVSRQNHNAADAYADMTVAELEAEAERRGVAVERIDGKDGDPLKSDYIRALSAADEA